MFFKFLILKYIESTTSISEFLQKELEDHRSQHCTQKKAKKGERCAVCAFPLSKIDKWDESHRAGAILRDFGEQSINDIARSKGWTTNEQKPTTSSISAIAESGKAGKAPIKRTHLISQILEREAKRSKEKE